MMPGTFAYADAAGAQHVVRLDDYLDAESIEAAEHLANAWIKSLRTASVDGLPLRDRLAFKDDSLWWFVELYLHKQRTVVAIYRTLLAIERLIAQERPASLSPGADRIQQLLVRQAAQRHGLATNHAPPRRQWPARARLLARAHFYTLSAAVDRGRGAGAAWPPGGEVEVAAFVHAAFWRQDRAEEGYIGPVLRALEERLPHGCLALIGVGPRTNFRVRRWRHRFAEFNDPNARGLPFAPIEMFAGRRDLAPSTDVWRQRGRVLKALCASDDVRHAAEVDGYDIWPLVRDELLGVTHLQLPWSARCMDQAGAALDALTPRVVLTYAEAGGWGRALVLEARRRGIPVVGLQHGFIYRHWLNYLHEADEMQRSPARPADRGFPRPDLTLLYDGFALEHLVRAGNFPPSALAVTGSPALEAFVEAGRRLTEEDRRRIRSDAGARPGQHLVVLATKFTQIGSWFAALAQAVRSMPDTHLVVKCHPAETTVPYEQQSAGAPNVVVLGPGTNLADLVVSADLIVTVNSTAAVEAMAVDVPGLVLALPNNLSPFVEAGALAGVDAPGGIRTALTRLLYDEQEQRLLAQGRRAFAERYGIITEGGAAARAADAILELAGTNTGRARPART